MMFQNYLIAGVVDVDHHGYVQKWTFRDVAFVAANATGNILN